MRVKNTENTPVPIRVYFKSTESCVPYDYLSRSKYHDLDHGCTNLYCNLGAHEYLDLDPVIVHGLTSNTSVKNPKISKMTNLVVIVKLLTILYEYTTALHRPLVFHAPKPIKLGPKGSSTKCVMKVTNIQNSKNQKNQKNYQKNFIFKKFKNTAKLAARALGRAGNNQNFFPTKVGKEKFQFFPKNFDIILKMSMSKTALRTTIGRTNQKLGQENHFLQKSRREIEKYMPRRKRMIA
jgi:hypothetical protein